MFVEVCADQLDEGVVPEHPRDVRPVLGNRVHQPVKVHAGVDLQPRQRVERRTGHHLFADLVVAPGHHPGDASMEECLELGQRHAASSSTAFSNARAFSASARTSSSGGM